MEKEKKAKETENENEEMEFIDCEGEEEEEEQKQKEDDQIEISDDIERSKVGIMRALVQTEDPSAKDVDDLMLRRFLRARDLDIEKASTMFLKYLSWRRTFLPKGFISESKISTQLPHNKLCMQGLDKQGRPIVVAFGGRHKPSKSNLEEVKRFVVYGLEKICARTGRVQNYQCISAALNQDIGEVHDMPPFPNMHLDIDNHLCQKEWIISFIFILFIYLSENSHALILFHWCFRMPKGQEKFVAIGDLEGWGYSNSDIRAYVASLSILQDCYPERLAKLFIVHVPYIFMTAWKIVYPFIDSRTKKKIVFVENKKLTSTLLRDIDDSQLPDIYGGKLPLVPIQDC